MKGKKETEGTTRKPIDPAQILAPGASCLELRWVISNSNLVSILNYFVPSFEICLVVKLGFECGIASGLKEKKD